MAYQSNFRKWTNRLIDEFSGREYSKQMKSTGDSFNRPVSRGERSDSQFSYKEMPSNYKRYADSLQHKRKTFQNADASFENIVKMGFVQYKHFPHQDNCAQECTLKKKTKRQCRCFDHKQRECCHRNCSQVIEQKAPTVIKEIHTIVVPSAPPPTIIREVKQPTTIVRPAPIIRQFRPVQVVNQPLQVINQPKVMNSYVKREVVHSRSPSNSKITINYVSPPKAIITQSVLIPPLPQAQKAAGSPYKLLQSSRKNDQIPQIVIHQPLQYHTQQLSESEFTFEESESRRQSKERRRIFPPREMETAKFIAVQEVNNNQTNRTYKTNMSESFKIFNADKEMRQSSMMYHKFKYDPIRE